LRITRIVVQDEPLFDIDQGDMNHERHHAIP
jgi:hypothetical protein